MRYFIFTLGCQMNKSDAERLSAVLEKAGCQKSTEEEADLMIVLACSVRQSATDRIWGKINQWHKWQEKKPLITILSGCVLLEDKRKFRDKFDYILTIDELTAKPQPLISLLKQKLPVTCYLLPITDYFHIHPKYESNFQAYVPISTGCNNFCTYCVVPFTRGREKSRPADEVISEVKELVKRGYKEITLLGQNVNSYKFDKRITKNDTSFVTDTVNQETRYNSQPFIDLLKRIDEIYGDYWYFFLTNHPKDMGLELTDTLPKLKKVGHYIHLPIQSGDDDILKKMNRHYTVEHYLKLIQRIKKFLPDVCLSTDIIVGFPGETEKQFQNTAKIMEEVKFDMAYIAQYSPRPGTAAYKLKDDLPKQEKKRREKILTEILKKTALENNQKYIGKITNALVIQNLKNNYFLAKTRTFKNVRFSHPAGSAIAPIQTKTGSPIALAMGPNPVGQFVKLKITKANIWGLEGKLVE